MITKDKAMKVDRSTPATYEQISTPQTCPLCHGKVDMTFHMWAKLDGEIAHDYCIRTKLNA